MYVNYLKFPPESRCLENPTDGLIRVLNVSLHILSKRMRRCLGPIKLT